MWKLQLPLTSDPDIFPRGMHSGWEFFFPSKVKKHLSFSSNLFYMSKESVLQERTEEPLLSLNQAFDLLLW